MRYLLVGILTSALCALALCFGCADATGCGVVDNGRAGRYEVTASGFLSDLPGGMMVRIIAVRDSTSGLNHDFLVIYYDRGIAMARIDGGAAEGGAR